jgi:formylmethanofuran dehydrogenase subunit E
MGRILFWLGLAALIYAAIVVARSKRKRSYRSAERKQPTEYSSVRMIKCEVCGTHFPEDEAVLGDGRSFCSEKCRKTARMKAARRNEAE